MEMKLHEGACRGLAGVHRSNAKLYLPTYLSPGSGSGVPSISIDAAAKQDIEKSKQGPPVPSIPTLHMPPHILDSKKR